MSSIHETFLISMIIILIGYGLKRTGVLSEQDGKTLAKIIFTLTLPAVILNAISNIELDIALIAMPIICVVYNLGVLGISTLLFSGYDREKKGIGLMSVIGFNVGNFAYPIIEGIWGTEGLQYIAMFDVGNALIMFIVVYSIAAIHTPKNGEGEGKVDPKIIAKKVMHSAPLLAYFIALGINIWNITLPVLMWDVIGVVARVNMGIVLITLGIFLNFNFEKADWGLIGKVIAIRYTFGLSIGVILYFILPFSEFVQLMVLLALMLPLGMAGITFAVELEYSKKSQEIIGTMVNITMIISFFLMWGMIAWLG